ncbi:efflux RND transporter permease subunit [Caloramator quimbayensis]|uniref:efflux RND transporter permease subunit n=1 Tax=Caloramator quimbayensis TaxID=1147123 RepID=UPI00099A5E64|nr:MMPL family transporter [Caloramator quimbayensis]
MTVLKKFGLLVTKHKTATLIIAAVLLIPAIFGMVSTKINYDILTYLPKNLDTMKGQEILDKSFHNAATSMLIVENMESKDVLKLKEKIEKVNGVEKVIWISDALDTSIPKEILPDEIKDFFYRKNSTLLFIKFNESASSKVTMDAISSIRKVTNEQCFLGGVAAIVKDTKDLADKETPIYVLLAVALCLLVLSFSMESYFIPFLFIISIGFAVVYNLGTNKFLGQISYITKALAAVLQLGVTMDYSIFLLHRYEEEKQKIEDKALAMANAIEATFVAITGSSLTTVAGFLALCVMSLGIGKDMGIVMAKGVLIGVLTAVTILPSLILTFDSQIHKYHHRVYLPSFEKTANIVTKYYKVFAIAFLILFIPAVFGQSNVKVYYNLDESLPKDLKSVVATNKLKNEYDMTTIHMILVNSKIPAYKINEMVKKIEKVDGIEHVIAYDKFVGTRIPESFIPEDIREISTKGGYKLLVATSKYKAATKEENNQVKDLNYIVKSYDLHGIVAGEGPLTKDLIDLANKDFNRSSLVSIASIFAIILLVFTSLSIPIILVLCIELAIFINMAIPFYMNQTLPFIASIVIGCIQLGATVDYAILLSSRFREEIRNGADRFEAMKIAVQGSAVSIVTSAMCFFAATIGVGLIAKMDMIQTLCKMLGRGALISMVVIILIMPSVLLVSEKIIAATSRNWDKKPSLKLKLAKEEE